MEINEDLIGDEEYVEDNEDDMAQINAQLYYEAQLHYKRLFPNAKAACFLQDKSGLIVGVIIDYNQLHDDKGRYIRQVDGAELIVDLVKELIRLKTKSYTT